MQIDALKPALLITFATLLGSCAFGASYQAQLTSMDVGCNADDVRISHHIYKLNDSETWTAECAGNIYDCTYDPDGEQSNCFLRQQ
jgi:hypothetical protein